MKTKNKYLILKAHHLLILIILSGLLPLHASSQDLERSTTPKGDYPTICLATAYFLETEDCLHRHGYALYKQFLMFEEIRQFILEDDNLDFWAWLDKKEKRSKTLNIPRIHYMDTQERNLYALKFSNNQVQLRPEQEKLIDFTVDNSKDDSKDDSLMFVMDKSGQFYIRAKYRGGKEGKAYHHSSFFSGEPVAGAGDMLFDSKGNLLSIGDNSGHYNPSTKEMVNVLLELEKAGVNLSKVAIDLHDIKDFYKAHGIIFKEGKTVSARYWLEKTLQTK